MREKSQKQQYRVIKEASYSRSFFSLSREGKEEIFSDSERQTFGAACERGIAQPILATMFQAYQPAMFIQEAWDRLYFEMLKLYEKRYGKSFSILGLLREKHFRPASSDLKRVLTMTQARPADSRSLELVKDILFPRKKLVFFADKTHGLLASVEKVELYERLMANPSYRKKIKRMEKDILFEVYEDAVLRRFPNLSRKDRDVLRKCISFPLRQDFFCVPKRNSRFKVPFYFVEVKSERVKVSAPALTDSQKKFIRAFKCRAGILILRMFFSRDNIKVQWFTPNI